MSFRRFFKLLICFILYYSGIIRLRMLWERRKRRRSVRVLIYHAVNDHSFPLSPRVTKIHFQEQMRYLKAHYQIVSINQMLDFFRKGTSFSPPAVLVTFDDGYKDVYTQAFPILRELRMSAIIFLTSACIGTGRLTWTEKLHQMVEKNQEKVVDVPCNGNKRYGLGNWRQKRRFCEEVERHLMSLTPEKRELFLENLQKDWGISEVEDTKIMLNWEEVREMKAEGIEFGSHSLTHPLLPQLSPDEIEREICLSKKEIEKNLSEPVVAFSYPSGIYDEKVKNMVRAGGYQCAFAVKGGVNSPDADLFELIRIHVEDGPLFLFACEVSGFLPTLRNLFSNRQGNFSR